MNKFTFIDLFAGIGGIRIGFERAGAKCVFSSEIDKFARKTYSAFFQSTPDNYDIKDITSNDPSFIDKSINDHDILTAGFPCQPFSLAGVSIKNSLGIPHGFEDKTHGTLFFDIKKIIQVKKPKVIFLENVKNLRSHNKGNTYQIIIDSLNQPTKDLQYTVSDHVIDASHWLPQHRERVFILCFRKDLKIQKSDIDLILSYVPEIRNYELDYVIKEEDISSKYTLTNGTWNALKSHRKKHEKRGNGFGYSMIKRPFYGNITRTLSARYYKDGAEILIPQKSSKNPRRLTPLECLRLQGFPNEYELFFNGKNDQPVSDHQAYKQLGNSVAVPVITYLAKAIIDVLSAK